MSAISGFQARSACIPGDRRSGTVAELAEEIFGDRLPVAIRTWDGRSVGPESPPAVIRINSPDALAHLLRAPTQIGLARAFAEGDITVEGDIFAVLEAPDHLPRLDINLGQWLRLARAAGRSMTHRPPAAPEEARLTGRRHSRERDRAAIAHHYDVSNEFYRLVLGPAMTYSCAVWASPDETLERAQERKHELVCRKLGLGPGARLLDVGCGWGTMARHAVGRHEVSAVGVTLSRQQLAWARDAVNRAPSAAEFRLQDYRDIDDGPYDAISSIGMSEHVGRSQLAVYFAKLYQLLKPGGRLLNHAISALPPAVWSSSARRWPHLLPAARPRTGLAPSSFVDRYIFPDGELIEVGHVVSAMQEAGFEVRHVESLREHYGLTLRSWVANLQQNWDGAVVAVGERRARLWLLYMAASARTFETGKTGIHQVLAVKPERGRSGLPLRPVFEAETAVDD